MPDEEATKQNPKQKPAEKKPEVSVAEFKNHIKGTEIKLVPRVGTNAVKFQKVICYVRDTKYGVSVWSEKNKTKKITTTEQLCKFVESLKKHVEEVKEKQKQTN